MNPALIEILLERLKALRPDEFVFLVAEHLRQRNDYFEVVVGPLGRDKGVDISAKAVFPIGEVRPVDFQCKRYKDSIGSPVIAEVAQAAIRASAASEIVIVSTAVPSQDARDSIDAWKLRGVYISWVSWCGKELAKNLVEKTPKLVISNFPDLKSFIPRGASISYLCPSFELVGSSESFVRAAKADRFYNGFTPTWSELAAGFDISRDIYSEPSKGIKDMVAELARRNEFSAVSLIGVAGVGKTVVLRRLALDLASDGFMVLRLREDWQSLSTGLSRQLFDALEEAPGKMIVIVDDVSDLYFGQLILEGFFNEIEGNNRIVLVVAEQSDRWNVLVRRVPKLKSTFRTFAISKLTPRECELLVDKIINYELGGRFEKIYCTLSREERLHLCEESADRQLLIAMLQMRYGQRFSDIVAREYERVPSPEGKYVYALVALFAQYKISLPISLVRRSIGLSSALAVQELSESIQGVLKQDRRGLSPRHELIGRAVVRHALATAESKKSALEAVLSVIDTLNSEEAKLFVQFFSGDASHRRIVNHLGRKLELVDSLYEVIIAAHAGSSPYFLKFIHISWALCARILQKNNLAREHLMQALSLDPEYAFTYRQLAWIDHYEGKWDEAAERAIRAATLASEDYLSILHCGRILSFSKVKFFKIAKGYLESAVEMQPEDQKARQYLEDYMAAEHVLDYLRGLKEEDFLPSLALDELRPGLSFLRTLHGPNSKEVRRKLKFKLRRMEEEFSGEIEDLFDVVADTRTEGSPPIRALVACNLARLKYLAWYHRNESFDPEEVEQLFLRSIKDNPDDPFTRCWYGTFLKESRKDIEGARREYLLALSLAEKIGSIRDHPLFLNNIALLIMDEVIRGIAEKDKLNDAEQMLVRAIQRLEEIDSKFMWPYDSLAYCRALMGEYGLTSAAQK